MRNCCVVGVFSDEGPPVPIPNTAVKLISADNTWLEAAREDKAMPTQKPHSLRFFIFAKKGLTKATACYIIPYTQSVSLAMRVHPFPSRTRQLSSSVLTILGWKRPGKIRRCRHKKLSRRKICGFVIFLF